MKRVLINNSKKFFKEILEKRKISLKKLSIELGTNYSNIMKWKRGKRTIPQNIFERLVKISADTDYWRRESISLEDNWGQIKGGKTWSSKISKCELRKKMLDLRKCKKIKKIKVKMNEKFCEFFGAIIGDGCLSRYKRGDGFWGYEIVLTGDKRYDLAHHKYLKKLIKKEFGIYVYSYIYDKRNFIKTSIKSKQLFKELEKLEFPVGVKGQRLKIPNKFLKLPWKLKKSIIRGIFDTDGSISGKKNEKYRYPYICLSSKSKKLIKQLYDLLRRQGYPCYINNDNLFIKGIANAKKWMSDIGSSNPKHKFKYEYWLKNKVLPRGIRARSSNNFALQSWNSG